MTEKHLMFIHTYLPPSLYVPTQERTHVDNEFSFEPGLCCLLIAPTDHRLRRQRIDDRESPDTPYVPSYDIRIQEHLVLLVMVFLCHLFSDVEPLEGNCRNRNNRSQVAASSVLATFWEVFRLP